MRKFKMTRFGDDGLIIKQIYGVQLVSVDSNKKIIGIEDPECELWFTMLVYATTHFDNPNGVGMSIIINEDVTEYAFVHASYKDQAGHTYHDGYKVSDIGEYTINKTEIQVIKEAIAKYMARI
jgi:hypothetical protein